MLCRSCKSAHLEDILSLGDQYLSDFREDDIKPPKYPLNLVFCPDCYLVQLRETTPFDQMYTPRYGFKSGVNDTIRADLKDIVKQAVSQVDVSYRTTMIDTGTLLPMGAPTVIDIGANDGTLLANYDPNFYRIAFEPIQKLADECGQHADLVINDFFSLEPIKELVAKYQKAKIITSVSMFYDVEDPNKFVSEVKECLAEDGVWSIQQNYLLTTLQLNAVDNICHEHLAYYSLIALDRLLARHDLEVFDCSTSMVNGGCIRTLVGHKGAHKIKSSVSNQRRGEVQAELHTSKPYQQFAETVLTQAHELHKLIATIHDAGERVYIYGASTRGGTIWQLADLDVELLPKAVERNPEKVGKKIASIGVPIISEEQAREEHPEYMLVSPWFFRDEFIEREKEYLASGGHFIFPLPELEIV